MWVSISRTWDLMIGRYEGIRVLPRWVFCIAATEVMARYGAVLTRRRGMMTEVMFSVDAG